LYETLPGFWTSIVAVDSYDPIIVSSEPRKQQHKACSNGISTFSQELSNLNSNSREFELTPQSTQAYTNPVCRKQTSHETLNPTL
jgi:hypothetical protein